MLNQVNNQLASIRKDKQQAKRRLFTFSLATRRHPRPSNKWNLNSSLETTYLKKIAPVAEVKLASID